MLLSKTGNKTAPKDEAKVPKHIGIIMDGNRRFAKRLMLEPWRGHEWGAKKAEDILDWCSEFGIKNVTLYSLSYENFTSRPKEELNVLLKLMEKEFLRASELKKVHENGIRFNVIGRPDMLPKSSQDAIKKLTDATREYTNFIVNLAVVYGGRQEIIDAAKKVAIDAKSGALDAEKLDEQTFRKFLYTNGSQDPEMIIRTGGEKRISGFLLWQSAYSELYFSEKLWPDFGKGDLKDALDDFAERDRRFGQ